MHLCVLTQGGGAQAGAARGGDFPIHLQIVSPAGVTSVQRPLDLQGMVNPQSAQSAISAAPRPPHCMFRMLPRLPAPSRLGAGGPSQPARAGLGGAVPTALTRPLRWLPEATREPAEVASTQPRQRGRFLLEHTEPLRPRARAKPLPCAPHSNGHVGRANTPGCGQSGHGKRPDHAHGEARSLMHPPKSLRWRGSFLLPTPVPKKNELHLVISSSPAEAKRGCWRGAGRAGRAL